MGYKVWIEYKIGASNRVADAISRRDEPNETALLDANLLIAVTQPIPDTMELL